MICWKEFKINMTVMMCEKKNHYVVSDWNSDNYCNNGFDN